MDSRLTKIIFFSFLTFFYLDFSPVYAQFDNYVKLNGPYGFRINKIIITEANKMFLASSWVGLYASDDNGLSWKNLGFKDEDVKDVVVDSDGNIFVLVDSYHIYDETIGGLKQVAGIFKSTDHGKTWKLKNNGFTSPLAFSIEIDNEGNLYVGIARGGLYISEDKGESWSKIGFGDEFVRIIYKDYNGYIYVGIDYLGLFRRKDKFADWEQLGDFPGLDKYGAKLGNILVSGSQQIFVLVFNVYNQGLGIYKLSNNGQTWETCNNGIDDLNIYSITETSDGILFTGGKNGRVFRSNNHGENWELISRGVTTMNVTSIIPGINDDLYISTLGSGLFVLQSNEATLKSIGPEHDLWVTGLMTSNEIIYCTTSAGIYFSEDGGNSWEGLSRGLSNHGIVDIVEDNTCKLFASTYGGGLFSLTNDKKSWDRVDGIEYDALTQFMFYSKFHSSIFIGINGLYRSINSGNTWEKVLAKEYLNVAIEDNEGNIFTGSWDVFRSQDGGDSWDEVKSLPDFVRGITCDSLGNIFVGTETGNIFKSSDKGDTWEEVLDSIFTITSLITLSTGEIIASTYDNDLIISRNNGTSWSKVSDTTLPKFQITKYISADNNDIYMGSNKGLFYQNNSISNNSENNDLVFKTKLVSTYPNPFNPSTTISFSIKSRANVTLKIYDLLGKLVIILVDEIKTPGNYQIDFDATNFGSGIYFYNLSSDGYSETKKMIYLK